MPQIFDSATGALIDARPTNGTMVASLYVCGITPYDATHLGHAATYLAYDTLIRLWLDAGFSTDYAQNVTDVDEPLLERAQRDGVDWRDLAESQIELFRSDMQLLGIIPPDHYVGVTETVAEVADAIVLLRQRGFAYAVSNAPDAGADIYFDSATATSPTWKLGQLSHVERSEMLALSAERGGDPERAGKRDPLDPLLWRTEREGEPAWETALGRGRPGWHIECSVIAQSYLVSPLTVNGGGSDLLYPHHEFSAGHTAALTGRPLAAIYSHTGMVGYAGMKMSKSRGNLVFVSRLVAEGTDPRVIRLALLAEHYRSDWEWTTENLSRAQTRLARWQQWAAPADAELGHDGHEGREDRVSDCRDDIEFLAELRRILANDLDTPAALAAIDDYVAKGTASNTTASNTTASNATVLNATASNAIIIAIDSLLGIKL